MARRRYISTDISIDKDVNKLASLHGVMAALLYTWMIPHAEDDRSITSDPDEILLSVIPGFRDVKVNEVEEYIAAMIKLKLLEAGENGKLYFPEKSFYKHQSYIPEVKRNRRKSPKDTEDNRQSPQNTASPSPSPSPSLSPSLSPTEEEEEGDPVGKIYQFYQDNIGMITRHQSELLGSYVNDGMDPHLIIEVMKRSLGKSDKWAWVRKVLNNLVNENVKTLEQFEARNMERQGGEVGDGRRVKTDSKPCPKYDKSKILYKSDGTGYDPDKPLDF